ncbi:MAG: SIMPL domain-containing protein [Patescibacteria group bacterium]
MNTQEMQNIYKWAWVILIILALFLGVKTLASLKGLRDINPAYNSISVSGEGEVFAVPDLATFSFTISADADTVSTAQAQVTEKTDAVIAALEGLGIEEKDIKTTDYSVWPKYRYEATPAIYPPVPGRQVSDGYTANHSITVKVRKTEDAGKALAAAGDNGATNLSSISFTIDDMDKITQEARAMAISDARDKAKLLSKELGVRLVRVISFNDSTDGGYPIPYGREGMGGDVTISEAKAPTVPVGENKVKVVVNVVYEIR